MKQPHLIQRCFLKLTPTCQYEGRIADFLTFDYMGSAEFEFGAVQKTYREMAARGTKFQLSTLRSLRADDESGSELRIYHAFDAEELDKYEVFLLQLRRGHHFPWLVEDPMFIKNSRVHVWFDLNNGCLWSFDKKFMKHTVAMAMKRTFQHHSDSRRQK